MSEDKQIDQEGRGKSRVTRRLWFFRLSAITVILGELLLLGELAVRITG